MIDSILGEQTELIFWAVILPSSLHLLYGLYLGLSHVNKNRCLGNQIFRPIAPMEIALRVYYKQNSNLSSLVSNW